MFWIELLCVCVCLSWWLESMCVCICQMLTWISRKEQTDHKKSHKDGVHCPEQTSSTNTALSCALILLFFCLHASEYLLVCCLYMDMQMLCYKISLYLLIHNLSLSFFSTHSYAVNCEPIDLSSGGIWSRWQRFNKHEVQSGYVQNSILL